MKHYPFGSSTAARTDACTRWFTESEGVPRQESSYAIDGTIIHGVLEAIALDAYDLPTDVDGHRVTDEHVAVARECWAATMKVLYDHHILEYEPEVTANTAADVGGTLDLVGWNQSGTVLMLLDYKTGQGVQVSPENNKQILFAAANILNGSSSLQDVIEANNFTQFLGVIVQPGRDGEIEAREWAFDIDDVNRFWANHTCNITLAREGSGDLVAGDHCKFCPANGLCDATTGNLLRMARLDPGDLAQLSWGLDHIEAVKDTIKNIEKMAYEQLEVGASIPGWKLVPGRPGNTTWDDQDEALKALKKATRGKKTDDDVRLITLLETRKLLSPTQAKKFLKSNGIDPAFIEEITHRPEPGKHTLAREDDPREAVPSTAAFAAAIDSLK